MIWNNHWVGRCSPSNGPPVQDAWGRASAPGPGHRWNALLILKSTNKYSWRTGLVLGAQVVTEPRASEILWKPLQLWGLLSQGPGPLSSPSFFHPPSHIATSLLDLWEVPASMNVGFYSMHSGLITSHTVQAFLALPLLMPDSLLPPLARFQPFPITWTESFSWVTSWIEETSEMDFHHLSLSFNMTLPVTTPPLL